MDLCLCRGILRKEDAKSTKNFDSLHLSLSVTLVADLKVKSTILFSDKKFVFLSQNKRRIEKYTEIVSLLDDSLSEHGTHQNSNKVLHDLPCTLSTPGWIQLSLDLDRLYIHVKAHISQTVIKSSVISLQTGWPCLSLVLRSSILNLHI